MGTLDQQSISARLQRDGYCFPLRVLTSEGAAYYRGRLEEYEARPGGPDLAQLRQKGHLLFTWVAELVRHPRILDIVEEIIGPNILCWDTDFFIKEANDPAYVSWHQDSPYWGLEPLDVVTVWVALTEVPVESGAVRFIPGSHNHGELPHVDSFHEHNLLSRGQAAQGVDESKAVDVPLKAGEASIHSIRVVHGSQPNTTANRRVGIAIPYIPPHVRQFGGQGTATLVRGMDTHGHFVLEPRPAADLDAAAMAAHAVAAKRLQEIVLTGTDNVESWTEKLSRGTYRSV